MEHIREDGQHHGGSKARTRQDSDCVLIHCVLIHSAASLSKPATGRDSSLTAFFFFAELSGVVKRPRSDAALPSPGVIECNGDLSPTEPDSNLGASPWLVSTLGKSSGLPR